MLYRKRSTGSRSSIRDAISELHGRCGVYTRAEVAAEILDSVGWWAEADLSAQRLLEPAAGDGVFVTEAAKRLIQSCRRIGVALTTSNLGGRIEAFEIHGREAAKARAAVRDVLQGEGVHWKTASALAKRWVRNRDFLTTKRHAGLFTHVVGNPPYVRWSKVPKQLKARYELRLPKTMTGGDLFLPFLHVSLEQLRIGGRIGLLCSDRWRYMAFAEGFRRKWLPELEVISESPMAAATAFVEKVDAYPTVFVAKKRAREVEGPKLRSMKGKGTLAEAGYIVRVGPALGCTQAFVLQAEETEVEAELLHPWLDGSEVGEGEIKSRGQRIAAMYGNDGILIDPKNFPNLLSRLKRYRLALEARSIVGPSSPWYRTIDRFKPNDWTRPKLLVPELAKVPRLALDNSGAIPSHGVYAIFAPDDDLQYLHARLAGGGLARALDGLSPKVKGGYVRCYRRFLLQIPL